MQFTVATGANPPKNAESRYMYHNNGGFPRKKRSIVISLEYYVCMHCGVLNIGDGRV